VNVEVLLARLQGVRRSGARWMALCPAHADSNPSLSIRQTNGKTLVHCHAGCSPEGILAALGIEPRDLFEHQRDGRRVIAEYDYCDEKGLLFQVVRFEPKAFRQRRPDGKGRWHWNLNGVDPVLYRLKAGVGDYFS
jgi:putative DNA primase/helicase